MFSELSVNSGTCFVRFHRETESELEKHFKIHDGNSQNECNKCGENFATKQTLRTHVKVLHNKSTKRIEKQVTHSDKMDIDNDTADTESFKCKTFVNLNCKFCDFKTQSKQDLETHKLNTHRSYKPCTKFAKGECTYGDACIFNHKILSDKDFICYTCGNVFQTKTELLKHIKTVHGHVNCRNFTLNKCRYSSEACFFTHEKDLHSNKETSNDNLDFQNVMTNLAPPDNTKDTIRKMEERLTQMIIPKMIQLIPQMVTQAILTMNPTQV